MVVMQPMILVLLSYKERGATMNIADRIQHLRKTKGISQEELADKVGVSRQAVSKWESEQSIPDIDKITILSDYFDVTTDYIIKGIESHPENAKDNVDARIFTAAGTAFNFIGLVVSLLIWVEEQSASSVMVGLILMTIGIMIYFIGQFIGDHKDKAKKQFWTINIWPLILIPYSCIFNFLQSIIGRYTFIIKPILSYDNSFILYILGWISYIIICILLYKLLSKE